MIIYKYNTIFIHIPKNAGTSILDCLEIEDAQHYPLSVLHGYMDKETFDQFLANRKYLFLIDPNIQMISGELLVYLLYCVIILLIIFFFL